MTTDASPNSDSGDGPPPEDEGRAGSGLFNDPHRIRGDMQMIGMAIRKGFDIPEGLYRLLPAGAAEIIIARVGGDPKDTSKPYEYKPDVRLRAMELGVRIIGLEYGRHASADMAGAVLGLSLHEIVRQVEEGRRTPVITDETIDAMFERLPGLAAEAEAELAGGYNGERIDPLDDLESEDDQDDEETAPP